MQEICLQHVAADGFPQVLPTTGWDLWQSWFLKTKLPLLWGTNKEENITAPKYIGYVQSSRRTTTMQSFNIVFLFCLLKHKWLCWATHKVNALFSHSFGHVHAILCNLMFKSSICVKAKVFICYHFDWTICRKKCMHWFCVCANLDDKTQWYCGQSIAVAKECVVSVCLH